MAKSHHSKRCHLDGVAWICDSWCIWSKMIIIEYMIAESPPMIVDEGMIVRSISHHSGIRKYAYVIMRRWETLASRHILRQRREPVSNLLRVLLSDHYNISLQDVPTYSWISRDVEWAKSSRRCSKEGCGARPDAGWAETGNSRRIRCISRRTLIRKVS